MYSELEVTQIINKIVKIVDETEGIRERGIYLSANICPDEGGAVRLMVDIRMENGGTISPLCRRIRISELLNMKKSSGVMVEAVSTDEQVKQAVKEFAQKLKAQSAKFIWKHNIPECIFNDIIADLLKEYEK